MQPLTTRGRCAVVASFSAALVSALVWWWYAQAGVAYQFGVTINWVRRVSPELATRITNRSPERVRLGRRLFFDRNLSLSRSVSCSTCHDEAASFADPRGHSTGELGTLPRNAPAVANLGLSTSFFWDGRADSLEAQAQGPLLSREEMGFSLELFEIRIVGDQDYLTLFRSAYDSRPTWPLLLDALATFQSGIVAIGGVFDRHEWDGEDCLSPEAVAGAKLFRGKAGCSQCHVGWNFTDEKYHDIGIPSNDIGRHRVTKHPEDSHRFKTPSLRNVSRTAPYMHDGSISSLSQVIGHYNVDVNKWRQADSALKPLGLSIEECHQLEAFLRALDNPVSIIP